MAFNKKINLLCIVPAPGNKPPVVKSSATVWAEYDDLGVTTKLSAGAANTKADLQVVMYRREFESAQKREAAYTHVEVNGVRYKIQESGKAKNDLHIKLILSKGD